MRFVHLSDLHVGKTDAEWPATLDLLQRAVALDPDGIVISGDLVERPDDVETLRQVRRALEETAIPFLTVPGNHDVQTPQCGGVFAAEFGPTPRVEEMGGATFLLFDSFSGLPIHERSERDHQSYAETGCWSDGRVPDDQFATVEHALVGRSGPRLAVVHHHLEPSPEAQVEPLLNAAEFGAWCTTHQVEHVFVGHLHRTAKPARVHDVMRYRIGRSTKPPYPLGILDLQTGLYRVDEGPG